MQQVYMNLALNAAEAIGADSGVISVSTRAELIGEAEIQRGLAQWPIEPGLFTCLEVCDTGCGMPPSTRARIFEPFFTTKFQGRGLGLAAVAGIVRAHKGAIQVISAPGEGSVFRVYLPAVNKAAEPLSSPTEAEQAPSSGGEILVVDDEESVCDLVTVALDRMGYHVHAARGGAEAIKIMAERGSEVDLILLDMSMPGMSGQETLERLRAVRPDVRVVVSSGYSESETLRAFGGSRLSGFVQKPYTVHQLEEQIRAALARPASA
jgi:CheY-like chemotaxis protein